MRGEDGFNKHERYPGWSNVRGVLRVLLTVLGVLGGLWLIYTLAGVIALVVLSIFFAYMLSPAVRLLERLPPLDHLGRSGRSGQARPAAILIVYGLMFGSLSLAVVALAPRLGSELADLGRRVPSYVEAARTRAQELGRDYRDSGLPGRFQDAMESGVARAIDAFGEGIHAVAASILGWLQYLPWLVLIPLLAFFFLKDADAFRSFALHLLPEGRMRWRGRDFLDDVNRTLALYVRAQLIACVIVGIVTTVGFTLLGVPYALLLGVLAGFLEFVPLVGPAIIAVLAGFLASTHSAGLMGGTLLFLVLLRMAQDYYVYPRLIASGMKLHPLVIILTLLCGSQLAGVAGMFLAIPAAAVVMVAYRYLLLQMGRESLIGAFVAPSGSQEAAPLRDSTPPRPFAVSGDPQDLSGISVAVVENDEDARRALVELLEESGAAVRSAGSAIEALSLLEDGRPDVLLSDLAMPDQDGFDLIRAIRALPPSRGGDLVAAALSGYATEEDRSRALAAGFQEHLSKPIDPTELILTVRSLADQAHASSH